MTERGFKGVWIPREIWLHPGLTLQEKILLAEIDSLDNENGCFANNKHFSEFLNISQRRVQMLVGSLKEKGYISVSFRYRGETKEISNRILRVLSPPYPRLGLPAEQAAKETSPGGEENFVGAAKETSPGGEENCAAYIRMNNTKLENQESISPLTPLEAEADFSGLSPELAAKAKDWLQYKRERREPYKPTGLKSLLSAIQNHARQYGDEAVIWLIDQCMAANYRGIIWDKLSRGRSFDRNGKQETRPTFTEIAEMMDGGELF